MHGRGALPVFFFSLSLSVSLPPPRCVWTTTRTRYTALGRTVPRRNSQICWWYLADPTRSSQAACARTCLVERRCGRVCGNTEADARARGPCFRGPCFVVWRSSGAMFRSSSSSRPCSCTSRTTMTRRRHTYDSSLAKLKPGLPVSRSPPDRWRVPAERAAIEVSPLGPPRLRCLSSDPSPAWRFPSDPTPATWRFPSDPTPATWRCLPSVPLPLPNSHEVKVVCAFRNGSASSAEDRGSVIRHNEEKRKILGDDRMLTAAAAPASSSA